MEVNLKSSCMVKPAEPTWNGSIPLSELDQIGSLSYVTLIHLYKPPKNGLTTLETIKSSLSKVLVPFYPLAGQLSRIAGSRLQIECNAVGAQLTEAESEATLDNQLITSSDQHHQLVPTIDVHNTPMHELPLIAVQFTRFKCGGICIGLAMSHAAMDGLSASHFLDEWARMARREPLDVQPFLCRKLIAAGNVADEDLAALPPPEEFDALPVLIGHQNETEKSKTITRASLRLTKSQVTMLKNKANESSHGHNNSRDFSRYESITAHIWRCASEARRHSTEQPTRLTISVDVRRRMQPPLPQHYFGNAVLDVAALGCSGDLVSKPLSHAANIIREAIDKVTHEYVRATVGFLKGVEDLSSFQDWNSTGREEEEEKKLVPCCHCENPNLGVASWLTLKFHGVDFGWGKEIYMGPVDYGGDGDFLLVPVGHGGGGGDDQCESVNVVACLEEEHMEAFKKLFYENIKELSVRDSFNGHGC